MEDNYQVIGTVQSQVNGDWSERTVNIRLYAVDKSHAQEKVLQMVCDAATATDPLALVRWHSPNIVRVYSI